MPTGAVSCAVCRCGSGSTTAATVVSDWARFEEMDDGVRLPDWFTAPASCFSGCPLLFSDGLCAVSGCLEAWSAVAAAPVSSDVFCFGRTSAKVSLKRCCRNFSKAGRFNSEASECFADHSDRLLCQKLSKRSAKPFCSDKVCCWLNSLRNSNALGLDRSAACCCSSDNLSAAKSINPNVL